jgi:hypothetical protein
MGSAKRAAMLAEARAREALLADAARLDWLEQHAAQVEFIGWQGQPRRAWRVSWEDTDPPVANGYEDGPTLRETVDAVMAAHKARTDVRPFVCVLCDRTDVHEHPGSDFTLPPMEDA